MADIELVIKMPEEQYNMILLSDKTAMSECVSKEGMMYAIKNGTPLPKGHGRLIDADKLKARAKNDITGYCYEDLIDTTPTIIEADKESD